MTKTIWLDTETSGTDPQNNALLQIAGIIDIDGIEKETFNFFVRPIKGKLINPKALECNKMTFEKISNFPDPGIVYNSILSIFDRYIDKYDKSDKFVLIGQNPWFDKSFLDQFFKDHGNAYLYSYIDYHLIDLVGISMFLKSCGKINPDNLKLETVCKILNIEIKAHDALEDCRAVKKCFEAFKKFI